MAIFIWIILKVCNGRAIPDTGFFECETVTSVIMNVSWRCFEYTLEDSKVAMSVTLRSSVVESTNRNTDRFQRMFELSLNGVTAVPFVTLQNVVKPTNSKVLTLDNVVLNNPQRLNGRSICHTA